MTSNVIRLRAALDRLWSGSRVLTAAALLMCAALAGSMIGLLVDPRTLAGAPAWLKPAKFAISTAVYMGTLAWIFSLLPGWPRMRRLVGWTTAVVMVLEVAIIDLQAWRGTTSHFNVGTRFDGVLFSIMGAAIALQTVTSAAVAVALWRERFQDRALGWALRIGMITTIVGASIGGLMARPTPAQIAQARATGVMTTAGAHTVGAPDGGPGLAGTGWSVEHGDLRVPHFVGLHAVQILPIIAIAARRRRSTGTVRVQLILTAATSYVALFGILLWQALRGQSIVQPDGATLGVLIAWTIATATGVWFASTSERRSNRAIAVA